MVAVKSTLVTYPLTISFYCPCCGEVVNVVIKHSIIPGLELNCTDCLTIFRLEFIIKKEGE